MGLRVFGSQFIKIQVDKMRTETKIKFLLVFSLVCFTVVIIQSVSLWHMEHRLNNYERVDSSFSDGFDNPPKAGIATADPLTDPFGMDSWFGLLGNGDPITGMQQRMESLLNSMSMPDPFFSASVGLQSPSIELMETETEYQLRIQTLPDQELEISTNLEDNRLTVSGVIKSEIAKIANGMTTDFSSQSQFSRRFDLPGSIDELGLYTEQTDAGVVIAIPKKA